MKSIEERNFHLLMGGLFMTSILLDPAIASVLDSWNPPDVTFVTLAVGLVWVGRYAAWRSSRADATIRELRERVDRLERAEVERTAREQKKAEGDRRL